MQTRYVISLVIWDNPFLSTLLASPFYYFILFFLFFIKNLVILTKQWDKLLNFLSRSIFKEFTLFQWKTFVKHASTLSTFIASQCLAKEICTKRNRTVLFSSLFFLFCFKNKIEGYLWSSSKLAHSLSGAWIFLLLNKLSSFIFYFPGLYFFKALSLAILAVFLGCMSLENELYWHLL